MKRIKLLLIIFTIIFSSMLHAGNGLSQITFVSNESRYGVFEYKNVPLLVHLWTAMDRNSLSTLKVIENLHREFASSGLQFRSISVDDTYPGIQQYLNNLNGYGYTMQFFYSDNAKAKDLVSRYGSYSFLIFKGKTYGAGRAFAMNRHKIVSFLRKSGAANLRRRPSTIPTNGASPTRVNERTDNNAYVPGSRVSSSQSNGGLKPTSDYTGESNPGGRNVDPSIRTSITTPAGFQLMNPVQGNIISGFGYRRNPFNGRADFHPGLDYNRPGINNAPIVAAESGVVIKSVPYGNFYGYGRYVEIKHNGIFATRYGHCSAVYVRQGQRVRKGQMIARVGRTGAATGPHLHFELRRNGQAINPVPFLR